jgi:hypothetical protein
MALTITLEKFVMTASQAFELCKVRKWDLSYSTLTGFDARKELRDLKTTNPKFWDQLTMTGNPPGDDEKTPEDTIPDPEDVDTGEHDSNVPISTVIDAIINGVPTVTAISSVAGR